MAKFFLDTGITLSNRAWKLIGKETARPVGLRLTLPDAQWGRLCDTTLSELTERIAFPFGSQLRTRWLQSSRDAAATSSTETAFSAMLLRHWDPELALEILRVFFDNRPPEGALPLAITPFAVSSFPAYPFLMLALCRYHESTGNAAGTRELYRKYSKYADWLAANYKREDGFYGHRDENWFRHDFLVGALVADEPGAEARWREVASVGVNSLMVWQYRLMSRAAIAVGEHRDGKKLDNNARKLADALNDKFWNAERNVFLDIVGEGHAERLNAGGFLPLTAEAPRRSQVDSMLGSLPGIVETLCRGMGSRRKDAVFLYLIGDGLGKYGLHAEAGKLAASFIDCAARLPVSAETIFQRVVAVNSLLEQVLGYFNFGDRCVFFPRLPEAWKGSQIRIDDSFRNLKIEFALGDNSSVDYVVAPSWGNPISFSVKNHNFKNVDLAGGAVKPL